MVTFAATIVDSETGASNTYEFDGEEGLFERPRAELIAAFMTYVNHVQLPKEEVAYEIVSAFKDTKHKCVTCIGILRLEHGQIPFMAMIRPKG